MFDFSFFNDNKQSINFEYLVNDPSTPDLIENVQFINSKNKLKFSVKNLNFKPSNKKENQALNCYITISNFLNYIEKNVEIKKWANNNLLEIAPQAGVDVNAYYDRKSLKFFYYQYGTRTIFTSDSSDIVSHELAHAILDAIRPDFWSVQSIEIWSFHEAFSDICSIVNLMLYDSILEKNLLNNYSNNISKLAEEIGILVYNLGGKKRGSLPDCLRNPAIEKYKYIDPKLLPTKGLDNELIAECHSFGRVFSGAWYEILIKIYEKELLKNSRIGAIKKARDIAFLCLLKSIPNSPKVINYYNAIAKCMISQCKVDYPEYASDMELTFMNWKIIENKIKILSNFSINDIKINKKDLVIKNNKNIIVRIVKNEEMKLRKISMLSNKYHNLNFEIANEKYYEFDENGILIDVISNSSQEIENSLDLCINSIETSPSDMWFSKNNKLIRNYIC